ncbi:MAG TPA: pitrilysin family protein [Planctomycetota bacterium]|nr:pitrilysin family protein [Planctomycetota bacterium]
MPTVSTPPRFRSHELPGGIRLAINSNRKLKTILCKVYLAADLDETVTARALLPLVLRRGTRRLPSMQAIHRHLESLYGASVSTQVFKVGEWHVSSYRLEVVNDRFLPATDGLFVSGIEFLRELLGDPHVENESFRPEWVAQEKDALRRSIESIIDDKPTYATHRLIEEMCREEPFRLHEQGRVEDLDAITPQSLWKSYKRWMATVPMVVYIAGDVDEDAVRAIVERELRIDRQATEPLKPIPPAVAPPSSPRRIEEKLEVKQARLVLGLRHGITYRDPDYEALLVMNGVLGGFGHSKLFQNVREKASLAYSASSWTERTKGLLVISCGIAAENEPKASRIILEQVDAVKAGDITDEEMEATISTLINHNLMLEDNYSNLAAADYIWSLHGRELDLEAFRERVRAVTKDDVARVAQRLVHDTTYFLHG